MTRSPEYAQTPDLLVEHTDGVLTVTLNRPEKANAFDASMMQQLRTLWASCASDTSLRCIVITGSGKAFSAGADASMLDDERPRVGKDAAEELDFLPGNTVRVPVIVAVNGVCAGGGLHFVSDADIRIAGSSARFLDPHVNVGQVSGLEPLELMMHARPDTVVRMALLGKHEVLDAQAALASGLVSEVVADTELLSRARELAQLIASNSPETVRITRGIMRKFHRDLLTQHLDDAWQAIQQHWQHPDCAEGPRAFLERREPRWED